MKGPRSPRSWPDVARLFLTCMAMMTLGLLGVAEGAGAQPYFEFRFQSDPGDYVGGGNSYLRTQATGAIDVYNLEDRTGDGAVDYMFLRYLGQPFGGTFIHFWVATNQLGKDLAPGTYPNAERAPFASVGHPGLDVEMDGRGCNTLAGNFVIRDATFGPGPVLERFDMDFEQHCEGAVPALRGTFRYNRLAPVDPPTPVPATGPLTLAALALLLALGAVPTLASRRRMPNGRRAISC
jgi:hypothetical protein